MKGRSTARSKARFPELRCVGLVAVAESEENQAQTNRIRSGASLKFNLGSEAKNYSALSSSTHVRIVLNHRLQQKHR